jgi:hypothetical protein
MSPHTLRAHVAFSFKGETHELDAVLDLDACQGDGPDEAPDFHRLLAREAGIDPYSYLYEVLESHEIEFSEPTGLAALSYHDGHFDWWQFVRLRQEADELQTIRAIAVRELGVTDLDRQAELKSALLAAYRAGQGAAN